LAHDDAEVFFIKRGAGPAAIWKVSLEGGAAVQISPLTDAAPEGFLAISPDGKWLAYRRVSAQPAARGENRSLRIGVLPIDGNADPKLFDLEVSRPMIQWAADSAAFYFVGGLFNSSSLCRQPLAGGEPQKLLDFPDRIFNFAWSRDGTNLVVSRGRRQGDAILITNFPE
jgi:Tol biopolymer transport system component